MGGLPKLSVSATDRVRLHITPFNPDLLDRYIPPSLKAQISDVSFHAIETFPERGFGFVEMPTIEGQRLKQKLNGTTLKGSKVRIEEARPQRKRKGVELEDEEGKETKKKVRREKAKPKDGVLPGYELEGGRHVKRGWKDDIAGKSKVKKPSKTEKVALKDRKMRFKTVIPPNAAPVETKATKSKDKDKKVKKERQGKKEVVVKEFAKSTKPSVTGVKSVQTNVLYEDGKGWVDESGNVLEAERRPIKPKRSTKDSISGSAPEPVVMPAPAIKQAATFDSKVEDNSEDSSTSVEESESSESESSDDVSSIEDQSEISVHSADEPSSVVDSATLDKEVHPLEALFKRTPSSREEATKVKKLAPIDTSFSFFNPNSADDEDDLEEKTMAHPPQTPHTKEDLEWRSIRSAAPTPDTAAIGKRFDFPAADSDDETTDEDETPASAKEDMEVKTSERAVTRSATKDLGTREESEFRKWFYENRGDLNRSWKKRRREEKKVVRQRENRRLGRRIA